MCVNNNKMCSSVFVILTIWGSLLQRGICQFEDDFCQTPRTGQGVCKSIYECPQAVAELRNGLQPKICGYARKTAIVCCPLPIPTLPTLHSASRVQKNGQKAWDTEICQTPRTGQGVCKSIYECPQAEADYQNGLQPKVCGYTGTTAIVCCPLPVPTLPSSSPAPEYQNSDKLAPVPGANCHSTPCNASTVQKNGQKAWDNEICQTPRTGQGVCKSLMKCPQVVAELKNGLRPKICGYTGTTAIVCCPLPVTTPPPSSPAPEYQDYEEVYPIPGAQCHPIPRNASRVQKKGQKAWDQCIEHLENVYPCQLAETLSAREDMARRYECGHDKVELAYGTHIVKKGEIPHMVLLGYGSSVNSASWACAGTIIHEHYILTAASCRAKGSDMVRFVRVGLVNISSTIDERRVYNVSQFIPNPQYNQRLGENNIGLVRTATPILNIYQVYPACLHTGNTVDDDKMMAVGWGLADFGGTPGSHLQKVTLNKLGSGDCIIRGRNRGLPNSQMCAGYPAYTSGTCQVDAGSPIQISNPDVDCMYIVLGVASVGPKCGSRTEHGIFTRVSPYIPWIESIVWT